MKIRAHARFNNLEVKDIRAVLVAFGGESMRIVDG